MASVETGGLSIQSKADLCQINGVAEQQFALFLLENKQHLDIFYEPTAFFHENGNGKTESTVPDFLLINNKTGRRYFIEITLATKDPELDKKERQRRVMKGAAEGEYYHVFYREDLERMVSKYPQLNFLSGTKIRPKE